MDVASQSIESNASGIRRPACCQSTCRWTALLIVNCQKLSKVQLLAVCQDGEMVDNCVPGAPAANDAICNGIDDDCSGLTDEDYRGEPVSCPECQSAPDTTCTDGSVHVICSASTAGTAGQFRPYRITATNADLSAWTSPVALGIPANYIDSFVVKTGSTYHNFLKNETTKYIEHATATSLNGPWTFVGTGNWAGWGSGLEGPALVRLPDGRWRIYFDQYGQKRYFYADSTTQMTILAARMLRPGVALVHVHSALDAPKGPLAGRNTAVFSMVLTKPESDGGGWEIAAFHNTRQMERGRKPPADKELDS